TAQELRREFSLGKQILLPDERSVTSVTKDFVDGDRVQVSQLVREGRRFGVSCVILGRISKIEFRQNREEVGTYQRTGTASSTARVVMQEDALAGKAAREEIAKEAIYEAVQKLIPDALIAMEKMDWQGRIAKIAGNKVYVNAGRASGLLAGDILKVLSPGEEIVDPVTKAFLGRSEGFLKGTLEVSDFIGADSSMTNIHTGGNFQEGDVVRLY
ncbi:hypothetical protein EB061_11815, partial [bacterium]|nr:hypothetical protein [bacterium]